VDRVFRGPDAGRSLTIHPDLDRDQGLGLAGRGVTGLVDRAVLGLVGPADPVDLGLAGLAGRGVTGLVDPGDRAGLVVLDLVDRVVLGLVGRVVPDLAGRGVTGLVDRVHLAGLGDLVDLRLVGPADLVGRGVTGLVGLVDRVGLAGLGDLVDLGLVGPADLVGRGVTGLVDLAGRVDRHRRPTRPGAHTIGVTRKWAAPLTRRTALAFPTMARRLRPGSTGSAGMADPLPDGLHITGTGRRLRVAGMVLRLPVVGTVHGMGRRAT
jgi:hypothetical protein